jgi:tRNA(Ile)-lysidine synthase
MSFSPERLLTIIRSFSPARRYWIAYSGGLDSHVLLHGLAAVRSSLGAVQLHAIHVHHGLHADADQWTAHCSAVCGRLSIPLQTIRVGATPEKGESPEAAARQARYRAFAQVVRHGECLLTAHHEDDQAETVLLQLLRGSGPHGLAGMPAQAEFHAGWLGRPLLTFSRAELRAYAEQEGLQWVEDSSNAELGYDRNYLRHEILPRLLSRWPSAPATIARAAAHAAQAAALTDQLAATDLSAVRVATDQLSVTALKRLGDTRARNVIRFWIKELGLPLPTAAHLERVMADVLEAKPDAAPLVRWPGAEVRRYRDSMYAMPSLSDHDVTQTLQWDLGTPLIVSDLDACLVVQPVNGKGVRRAVLESAVTVGFRRGGERCRPVGRAHTQQLKKLLQEQGIPPWQRDRIPLLYCNNELAAVVGLWVCEPYGAGKGEPGYTINMESTHQIARGQSN